jgi:UDP-N-acetylmuramate--alanine ligase
MKLLDSSDPRPIHFVGAAGAGMSALAELFARRGARVTGCDAAGGTPDLERLGIHVAKGHDASHAADARALIVTSAMAHDHPELVRARELGLPVIRRAEALAEAVSGSRVIGVAGTHGKTTTTVMTTEALTAAGLAPTGIAGGRVGAWNGNLSEGSDALFVVEADEYDRSFLALTPDIAIITNVEADHLDIYKDLDDIRAAFGEFARRAKTLILCADDPGATAVRAGSGAQVIRYGLDGRSRDARLVARGVRAEQGGSVFTPVFDGDVQPPVTLRVPGEHNVLNALAALAAGLALGVDAARLAEGLARFTGVERRFQRLGDVRGITVIDDYAHHPTEISATLAAARAAFPGRRIVAAFQPHLFTRTRDFAPAFAAALTAADAIFLTEIYPAREQPLPGVSSELIVKALRDASAPLAWRGERSKLAAALGSAVREGDVVITLGAGDITRTGPELLARLAAAA